MTQHVTDLKPWEYMDSLAMSSEKPSEVYGLDGAALWRVTDDHFVMLVCTSDHDGAEVSHRGPQMLLRVLPATWACFAVFVNPIDDYEAHHYGPVQPDREFADAH